MKIGVGNGILINKVMTRTDIEKAAVDSCVFENSIFNPALTPYYEQGFKDGADWRINSVWHDAAERPQLGELIIVEVYGKIWEYGKSDVCDTNHPAARWAYMNDLILNTEE